MSAIPPPKSPPDKPNLSRVTVKFRLQFARRHGKWSCEKLSSDEISDYIDKLKHYKQMTVAQFRQASGPRLKNMNVGLPPPPEELSEDIKNQLAQEFRVSRRRRVLGYLMEDEFFIIWLDPDHTVAG